MAIVLAAGESRRMGAPKLLLPWGGGTVLSTVVETLLQSTVNQVVVVLGHRADAVAEALGPFAANPRVCSVANPRYREGMLTSVQCGARHLGHGDLLVALGDQPLVDLQVVQDLLAACRQGIAVPTFSGRRGHPIGIAADLVAPLLALPAPVGLRGLFQAYPDRVTTVATTCPGVLVDLDTPADYARHQPSRNSRASGGSP